MLEPFYGSYFGHALFKVYQYATKVTRGLAIAFIKSANIDIQKCIA
jgi:hypothetical protein